MKQYLCYILFAMLVSCRCVPIMLSEADNDLHTIQEATYEEIHAIENIKRMMK